MHKSNNIPLPGRKLLPLTQTAPHPCTSVKNSMDTEKDKNSTNRLPTPAFLCSSPFTEHKPKCLRICQRQLLPVNSQQLLTRVGAMEDGSAAYLAQLLPLSTAHHASPPSRQRGRARSWTRLLGKFQASPGAPRSRVRALGPPLVLAGPPRRKSRRETSEPPTSHLPAPKQARSRRGPAGLHYSLVTSPTSLGRPPSSHPHTNFPNSAAA